MQIDAEVDEIPYLRGGKMASGTAFVTRAAAGHTWDGTEDEVKLLINPSSVSRLVVFDTWTLNCDRHPADLANRKPNYDNVFLEKAGAPGSGSFRLLAMDHTHCFTCGRDIDRTIANINRVKDDRLYGLFPAFVPRVREDDVDEAVARLQQVQKNAVKEIVDSIPGDWQVSAAARRGLIELIVRRADFVAETIPKTIARRCWPDKLSDFG